jgi:hypothetical protein
MCGPHSFNGPVWARRVPIFISWAKAPEIKANKDINTLAKIMALFTITSCFLGSRLMDHKGNYLLA